MCHLILGDTKCFLTMFVRKKNIHPAISELLLSNIAELEAHGYKYIIGAKIKNESQEVKNWILEQPKRDCQMVEYDKGGGRRLLVGYTDDRAKKDAYNREKGIRRLEKAYKHGALTKGNINKRGYNKFLSMDGEVKVTINYERIADDSKWDGLKGYLTNTDIPIQDVYAAYHNLWHVERAFRIAKSKIEILSTNSTFCANSRPAPSPTAKLSKSVAEMIQFRLLLFCGLYLSLHANITHTN